MNKKQLIIAYIALCGLSVGGYALAAANGWYPFISSSSKSGPNHGGSRGGGGGILIHK